VPEDHTHQPQLCVPVREAACGFALRMFRDRDGSRCAVAFSSGERLRAVLGDDQHWLPLSEPALRALAAPLGVDTLIVDPNMIAPTVRQTPAPAPVTSPAPSPAIALTPAAPSLTPVTPSLTPVAAVGPARPGHTPTAAAHPAPRWRNPGYSYTGVLRATVAVGAADLLLQLLS